MTKKVAIVIPVFCESGNIVRLYDQLEIITSNFTKYTWEYIFVNDGSTDDTWQQIERLVATDAKIVALDLSRNFGKEAALTAGVHHALHADAVICMDGDLQHPPEYIPEIIDKWEQGAEIVATVRTGIEKEAFMRKAGSRLFYWIMNKISDTHMPTQTTDFRLYDKKVVREFVNFTEHERMFRGIMDWMGFRKAFVKFQAAARGDGNAGYSYQKLFKLALNSITTFSLFPLHFVGYLGVLITTTSGFVLAWMFMRIVLIDENYYTPLAIVVVANTFLIGIVLMAIGLVSIYIANIHVETINRPLYLIRERLGKTSK